MSWSKKVQFSFFIVCGYQRVEYSCQIIFADSSLVNGSLGLYSFGSLYFVKPLL